MNRSDCELEELGRKISERYYYPTIQSFPLSIYGIITSGYYGNLYSASKDKYGPKKINYILPNNTRTNMLHSSEKFFILKLMHDSKYNRRDINRLKKVQNIIKANICPHFPIMYGIFKIGKVTFRGINGDGVTTLQNITKKTKTGIGIGYMMENLGHMTLENYVYWKPNAKELKQILFQCFVGIYALIKYAKMNHSDFHFKNIMIKEIPKPAKYTYIINNIRYQVVARKYIPIIIDINGNNTGQRISHMKDIKKLSKQIRGVIPRIWKLTNIQEKPHCNLQSFFKGNFQEYKRKTSTHVQITDEIEKQDPYLYEFI